MHIRVIDRRDPDAVEQEEDYVSMSFDETLDKTLAIKEEWREEKTNE